MVVPRRKLTKGGVAGYGLTVFGAVITWTALIFSLNVGAPISVAFIAVHVFITLAALACIVFVDTPISPLWAWLRWDDRRIDRRAYEDAVRAYRALDAALYDDQRADLEDTVRHLRTVVCHFNGWDPRTECDTGGLADQSILAYWERKYPEEFRLHP